MPPADSAEIEVEFDDGQRVRASAGRLAEELLRDWNPKEREKFLAAMFDGTPVDLSTGLERSGRLSPLTFAAPKGREILQHSAAHLVAKAITEWIPDAKPTNGPPTEDGFYYDFEMRPLTTDDLPEIASRMQLTVRRAEPYRRSELSKAEARRLFASNPHKLRYIEESPEETVSVYYTGTFVDLCRGPHVPHAGWLEGTHILGFSAISYGEARGATRFQRVRGVGFPTKAELERYLATRAEAEARDHRTLGPRLELFTFSPELPGFPLWHPKGMVVVRELEKFVAEHLRQDGYAEIRTPLMFPQSVYETSGHWELYRENMFLTQLEQRTFGLKPMNCPGSMLIFGVRSRSYRELPMRLAEWAPLHRVEASGTIHGLTRARAFIQDDAHLFVTEDQVGAEVRRLVDWVQRSMATFRLGWSAELSTRPEKFLGEPATWDRAEAELEKALKESRVDYSVRPGEGAFYGPKIDIQLKDSMGRSWQCGTIQLDYQIPARFGLLYQGADGALHTPIVIHRTILGSWERFLGVLLEHTAGRLPPWLSPVQVRVLPVTDRQVALAAEVADELKAAGLRAESTDSQETLSKRVRETELLHIPYIAVVGDEEATSGTVALRVHGQKAQRKLRRHELIELAREKVGSRAYDP